MVSLIFLLVLFLTFFLIWLIFSSLNLIDSFLDLPGAVLTVSFTYFNLLIFLLSLIKGKILPGFIFIPSLILILVLFFLKFYFKQKLTFNFKNLKFKAKEIILVLILALFFYVIFSRLLILKNEQIWAGNILVWVDWPIHLAITHSFFLADNFPPLNPIFGLDFLRYHFLADFFSSLWLKFNFNLPLAMTLPGFLLTLSFSLIFFKFINHFTSSFRTKVLSLFLVFFNGGFGFVYFFQDLWRSDSFWQSLKLPPHQYTYWGEKNLWFINLLWGEIIPQRGFLFGLPLAFLILHWLLKGLKLKRKIFFLLSGVLMGILPFHHSLTFLALLFFLGIFNLLNFLFSNSKIKLLKHWLWFWLPCLGLFLPQIPFFLRAASKLSFHFGWLAENQPVWLFWLLNTGPFIFLSLVFFFFKGIKKVWFYWWFSGFFLFLLVNLFSFTPWKYDNMKILTYWYLILLPLIIWTLNKILKKFGLFPFLALFFCLTFSGFLDVYQLIFGPSFLLWQKDDLALTEFIKQHTPKKALFLTPTIHNHPVSSLAGRRQLMGYPGTLWTWGLDYQKIEKDIQKILRGKNNNFSLLKTYQIEYVVLNKNEINLNWQFFKSNLTKIYENNSYLLFKVP